MTRPRDTVSGPSPSTVGLATPSGKLMRSTLPGKGCSRLASPAEPIDAMPARSPWPATVVTATSRLGPTMAWPQPATLPAHPVRHSSTDSTPRTSIPNLAYRRPAARHIDLSESILRAATEVFAEAGYRGREGFR